MGSSEYPLKWRMNALTIHCLAEHAQYLPQVGIRGHSTTSDGFWPTSGLISAKSWPSLGQSLAESPDNARSSAFADSELSHSSKSRAALITAFNCLGWGGDPSVHHYRHDQTSKKILFAKVIKLCCATN